MHKVLQILPSLTVGGAEKFVIDLITNFKNTNVHLLIFNNIYDDNLMNLLKEKNIKISIFSGSIFKKIINLILLIKNEKFTVVHSHLYIIDLTNIYKLFFPNIRWINTIHNDAFEEQKYPFLRKIRGFFYKYKLVIPVVISNNGLNSFINAYKVKPILIENGISNPKFNINSNEEYNNTELELLNSVYICSISRISRQKNIERLIKLASKLDGYAKVIHIGPSYDDKYKSYIDSINHKNIHFLGKKSNINLVLENSKCFVLTSNDEGLPITGLEALAYNLPIVSTDVGGISDLVANKNGFVVKIEQNEDDILDIMKKHIIFFIQNENFIKNNSVDLFYKNFKISSCVDKYIGIYD